jgi:hypothetical protein
MVASAFCVTIALAARTEIYIQLACHAKREQHSSFPFPPPEGFISDFEAAFLSGGSSAPTIPVSCSSDAEVQAAAAALATGSFSLRASSF